MLARLFVILLLAFAAIPVGATTPACHDAMPAMASHAMPTTTHHDTPAAVDHGCIGCAALGDWLAERVTPPMALAAAAPASPSVRFRLGTAPPPMLPPPRVG